MGYKIFHGKIYIKILTGLGSNFIAGLLGVASII